VKICLGRQSDVNLTVSEYDVYLKSEIVPVHAMQVYGVVEVQLLAFLTIILDGGGNKLHALATLCGERVSSNTL
jgi:hypothetical protein